MGCEVLGVRGVQCGVYIIQCAMWSGEWKIGNGDCGGYSVDVGVRCLQGVVCGVCSVECEVWGVEAEVWNGKCGVQSVD